MNRLMPSLLLLVACAPELNSPDPVVDGVSPGLTCNAQVETPVTLSGEAFTPVLTNALSSTPRIHLPEVLLTRVSDANGNSDDEVGLEVELGPTGDAAALSWIDDSTLGFRVVEELGLPAGVWDVAVVAADGESGTLAGGLTLLDPPGLDQPAGAVVCLDQGDQQLALTGSDWLYSDVGDITATLGDLALTVEGGTCASTGGLEVAETCSDGTVTVPSGSLEPGVYDLTLQNPDPGACESEAPVRVQVVSAPVASAISDDTVCLDQGAHTVVIDGDGWLRIEDALPTLTLDGTVIEADALYGCTPLTGPVDAEVCTELEVTLPAATLATGFYDVVIENPAPASCSDSTTIQLEVVSAPVVESIDPGIECAADQLQDLTLVGSGFLVLADGTVPSVELDGLSYLADALTGCTDLDGGGQLCDTLTVAVDGALDADVHDVVVVNPDGYGCEAEPVQVELVDGPWLASMDLEMTCIEQGTSTHTITGEDFVVLGDGTLPAVTVGSVEAVVDSADDCTDLDGPEGGQVCGSLTFTLPEDSLPFGLYPVSVQNPAPADCAASTGLWLEVLARPALDRIEPAQECTDDGDEVVYIRGTGFVELADGTVPTVTVDGTTVTGVEPQDCEDLQGPEGGQVCNSIALTLPANTLPDGVLEVEVTNPDPVACVDTDDLTVELVPAPEAATVTPELVCVTDGDRTLSFTGTGFVQTDDGETPTVWFADTGLSSTTLDGCTALTGPDGGETCTGMDLTIPQGAVPGGLYGVTVVNPDPVECAADALEVEIIDGPVIDELDPAGGCTTADPELTVQIKGSDFLFLDGEEPTVTVDGDVVALDSYSDCTALSGPAGGTVCQTLTITVDIDALGVGEYDVIVSNPGDNTDCVTVAVPLTVNDPPEVTSVDPDLICEGGGTVTLYGEGFSSSTVVLFDTTEADSVTVISDTEVLADVPADLDPGVYDITVYTAEDCSSTLENALEITEEPTLLFMDPPVTYTEISVQATIYVAGADYEITDLYLEDSEGDRTTLDYEVLDGARLIATIPSGLTADTYSLWLEDEIGCEVSLSDAITVSDELTVAVEAIEPAFGWTDARTATEITAQDPADTGMEQFEDIPRVYLSPSSTSDTADTGFASAIATALTAVSYESAILLDAAVPEGLEVGFYDVLVINPDGSIGLLPDGYEVTEAQPPVIDSVSPASVSRSANADVTISGEAFDVSSVTFECDYTDGTGSTTVSGTVNSSSSTELDVTVPSGSFSTEAVCLVVVTNSDGTFAEYASLSISSPSGNLPGWTEDTGIFLSTPRRASAAAAARSTATARYLYVMGGDSGSSTGAYDTVEATRVSRKGTLDEAFEELPQTLPEARTLAGTTVVGRHVFLLGGNDGSSPVDTAWRAEVLDPDDAPQITDIEIDYGTSAVDSGTWLYRVAVLYAATDANNPGGESLPSDPFVMRLPEVGKTFDVTLTWDAVDGADGYRIYRTPTAGAGSGTEAWVADVDGTATDWTDQGFTADTSIVPREKGQLGEWAELDALSTAREAPCVATATDPVDDSIDYIYVAGGWDGTSALDTIEYLDLTTDSDGVQTAGSWTTATETLSDAVWSCSAFAVDDALHSVVSAGESWVYFVGGEDTSGALRTGQTGQVDEGGDLIDWDDTISAPNPARSGCASLSAGDNLYMLGGQKGAASDKGVSTEIDGPPSLAGWNNLGAAMNDARYLPGFAAEAGIFIIVGGVDGSSNVLDSVEYTNF